MSAIGTGCSFGGGIGPAFSSSGVEVLAGVDQWAERTGPGQPEDIRAAVAFAEQANEVAVVEQTDFPAADPPRIEYRLISIYDEPVSLVIEGVGGEPTKVRTMRVVAAVGRFVDIERSRELADDVIKRLAALRKGPSTIDWDEEFDEFE